MEAGGWRLEAGAWRLEHGGERPAAGNLGVGSPNLRNAAVVEMHAVGKRFVKNQDKKKSHGASASASPLCQAGRRLL